ADHRCGGEGVCCTVRANRAAVRGRISGKRSGTRLRGGGRGPVPATVAVFAPCRRVKAKTASGGGSRGGGRGGPGPRTPGGTKSRKKLQGGGRVCPADGRWGLRGLGSGIPLDRQRETCDGWINRTVYGGHPSSCWTRTSGRLVGSGVGRAAPRRTVRRAHRARTPS